MTDFQRREMNLFERNLRLVVLFSFLLIFADQRFHRIRKMFKIFAHVDRSQRIILIDKTQSEKNERSRRERERETCSVLKKAKNAKINV